MRASEISAKAGATTVGGGTAVSVSGVAAPPQAASKVASKVAKPSGQASRPSRAAKAKPAKRVNALNMDVVINSVKMGKSAVGEGRQEGK